MKVYRFDDGAVYWIVAPNIRTMFNVLFACDAHDGWEDVGGAEWRVCKDDEQITVLMDECCDAPVPRDCVQDGHRWTAAAKDWAAVYDEAGPLACSEWP